MNPPNDSAGPIVVELDEVDLACLEAMAAEAGRPVDEIIASILSAVLHDDAVAHGRTA